MSYGITDNVRRKVDLRIKRQIDYLKDFNIKLSDDTNINMLEQNMGANINPDKYFAEVNNRVNAIMQLAKDSNLVPMFLTVTLPSEYHPSSEKYNPDLSIKDGIRKLSTSWSRFTSLRFMRRLKKEYGISYIKVYEPHKSGVAHQHIMLFVPASAVYPLRQLFKKYYIKLGFNFNGLEVRISFKKDGGAVAYILKYINKSFKNSKDGTMPDTAYWYAYHKVVRFSTSRTTIPIWMHRKIRHKKGYTDIFVTTKHYKARHLNHFHNKELITHFHLAVDDGEIIVKEKTLYTRNFEVKEMFKKEPLKVFKLPKKIPKETKKDWIPVLIEGEGSKLFNINTQRFASFVPFAMRSLSELFNEYRRLKKIIDVNNVFDDMLKIHRNRFKWLCRELLNRGMEIDVAFCYKNGIDVLF